MAGPVEPLTIPVVYRRINRSLTSEFGTHVSVLGEIRKLQIARSGHCYFDLVEPGAGRNAKELVLGAACFATAWPRVHRRLSSMGIELADGMVVAAIGKLTAYDGSSRVQLIVEDIDYERLAGRLAEARAALRRKLVAEGLFDAQREFRLADVPFRVGLVASGTSEGYSDWCGVIERSGFSFNVAHVDVAVQGDAAPQQIANAVRWLAKHADVVVVVRGGGSASDLTAFDQEAPVRAIANASVPVLVGVGHTGDRSLADEVAFASYPTPTACAQALVDHVTLFADSVAQRSAHLVGIAAQQLKEADQRLDAARRLAAGLSETVVSNAETDLEHRRATVVRSGRLCVVRHTDRVIQQASSAERLSRRRIVDARQHLTRQTSQVPVARLLRLLDDTELDHSRRTAQVHRAAARQLSAAEAMVAVASKRVHGLAPQAVLRRGFALVRADGAVVTNAASVETGTVLEVELASGRLTVQVTEVDATPSTGEHS